MKWTRLFWLIAVGSLAVLAGCAGRSAYPRAIVGDCPVVCGNMNPRLFVGREVVADGMIRFDTKAGLFNLWLSSGYHINLIGRLEAASIPGPHVGIRRVLIRGVLHESESMYDPTRSPDFSLDAAAPTPYPDEAFPKDRPFRYRHLDFNPRRVIAAWNGNEWEPANVSARE